MWLGVVRYCEGVRRASCALAVGGVLLCKSGEARATLFDEDPLTCPVPRGAMPNTPHDWRARLPGRAKWEQPWGTFLQSMTITQVYLDGKPVDSAGFELPRCLRSGLVLYKPYYSFAEARRLHRFVATSQFARLRAQATSRYLALHLMRELGERPSAIARMALTATWEARTPFEYRVYATTALEHHLRLLEDPGLEYYERQKLEMLVGELERRLGLFERARARFLRLKPDSPRPTRIVQLELRLIEAQDSAPQLHP